MSRLRRALNWTFVVLFIVMLVVAFAAPNAQTENHGFNLHSLWGRVWLGLVIAIFALAFVRGYLRRVKVKELAAAAWPEAPFAASLDSSARFDEYTIHFEETTHSWVFTADGKTIGAFRQIEGDLGEELNILGENFRIDGNALQKDGKTIAEGKHSTLTGRVDVTVGRTTYAIRQKSFTVFKDTYRMTDGNSVNAQIKRQRAGGWNVSSAKQMDAVIIVFAYWLVVQRQME